MKNDGGPAFPATAVLGKLSQQPGYDEIVTAWPAGMKGMSLRDWFAGMAMQGILGTPAHMELIQHARKLAPDTGDSEAEVADYFVACKCYETADAMLRHRSGEDQMPKVETRAGVDNPF